MTISPVWFESIHFHHKWYPRKPDNPKHTDCLGGTAWFVFDRTTVRVIGRVWRDTDPRRHPGCWTWALHAGQLPSGALGEQLTIGHADSKAKAAAALVAARANWRRLASDLVRRAAAMPTTTTPTPAQGD